jgi:hypothetical protein
MGLSTEELVGPMEPKDAIKYLARIIDSLNRRMEIKEAQRNEVAEKPTYSGGAIPRGQYRGRDHDDIVSTDPHHVVWLANNGHATGLGYTEEHIDAARLRAETTPEPRRGRR